MSRTGRRPSTRRHMSVVVAVMCAALGHAATAPAPAAAAPLFFVKVQSQGSFVANYGEDRHASGTRGFGTDGEERISWQWEVQAVGRPTRTGHEFRSRASRFRAVAFQESDLVEYDHLGGPSGGQLREFPACERSPYA